MRNSVLSQVVVGGFLLAAGGAQAFVPAQQRHRSAFGAAASQSTSARHFGLDPSFFHDIPHHVGAVQDALSSLTLSDLDAAGLPIDPSAVTDAVAPAAGDAAADAATAAASSNGWFGFLTSPIEGLLILIHNLLVAVGLSGNAWGVSIIGMTILIKLLTYPLTKTQLEGTNKMQQMQPAIKEIQTKYASNPDVMNQKVAEFYQNNDINPLAGCLPSIVQIPIFIGLYRAVLGLAKSDSLDERFLWLPNLEGPTYGADPAHASEWILKGWTDAGPSLGWDDTIAFLILPVLLVISQFVSMELMQPKSDDPAQQQSNVILKFLPLMIGWFSLSVPAALTLYWFTNNLITTGTSLMIRNSMKVEPAAAGGGASASIVAEPKQTIFAPPREKPSGFGQASAAPGEVKPITAPIDAVVVEAVVEEKEVEVGDSGVAELTSSSGSEDSSSPPAPAPSQPKAQKKGGKKRRKPKKKKKE